MTQAGTNPDGYPFSESLLTEPEETMVKLLCSENATHIKKKKLLRLVKKLAPGLYKTVEKREIEYELRCWPCARPAHYLQSYTEQRIELISYLKERLHLMQQEKRKISQKKAKLSANKSTDEVVDNADNLTDSVCSNLLQCAEPSTSYATPEIASTMKVPVQKSTPMFSEPASKCTTEVAQLITETVEVKPKDPLIEMMEFMSDDPEEILKYTVALTTTVAENESITKIKEVDDSTTKSPHITCQENEASTCPQKNVKKRTARAKANTNNGRKKTKKKKMLNVTKEKLPITRPLKVKDGAKHEFKDNMTTLVPKKVVSGSQDDFIEGKSEEKVKIVKKYPSTRSCKLLLKKCSAESMAQLLTAQLWLYKNHKDDNMDVLNHLMAFLGNVKDPSVSLTKIIAQYRTSTDNICESATINLARLCTDYSTPNNPFEMICQFNFSKKDLIDRINVILRTCMAGLAQNIPTTQCANWNRILQFALHQLPFVANRAIVDEVCKIYNILYPGFTQYLFGQICTIPMTVPTEHSALFDRSKTVVRSMKASGVCDCQVIETALRNILDETVAPSHISIENLTMDEALNNACRPIGSPQSVLKMLEQADSENNVTDESHWIKRSIFGKNKMPVSYSSNTEGCKFKSNTKMMWTFKMAQLARQVGGQHCNENMKKEFFDQLLICMKTLGIKFFNVFKAAFNFQPNSVSTFALMFFIINGSPYECIVHAGQVKYLQWVTEESGYEVGFKYYSNYCNSVDGSRTSIEFHQVMRSICLNRVPVKLKDVLVTYQNQCIYCGQADLDVWVETLEFVISNQPNMEQRKSAIKRMVNAAKGILIELFLDDFFDIVKQKGDWI